jgi:hypothetical protein
VALLADFGTKKGSAKSAIGHTPQKTYHFVSSCNIAMLVAGPAAPPWQKWQKWQGLTGRLTNYCLLSFHMFLLNLPGLSRFAALSQPAGFRAVCKPLHRGGSEPKAIRL